MYFLNSVQFWVLALCPKVCQHLSSGLKCSYVPQEPLNILVHVALIEAEIMTSPLPHVFSQLSPVLKLALCPQVCQHQSCGLKMFLCVSETSKNLVHGALIEAEILTSLSPCISSTQPSFGHWHSFHRHVNTSQVV